MQLLGSLLTPLCTLWLIGAGIAYYLAVGFANDAYDHQLINSADSITARLKPEGTKLLVDLPPAAQAILRHNDRDKFYYQILNRKGERISGDGVIPGPFLRLDSEEPVMRYGRVDGDPVRIVRVRVELPNYIEQTVLVQVAETLNTRNQLARQILLSILIPQVMLIALGAFAVWRGVTRGLSPLKALEQELALRSPMDLTPVQSINTPCEVRPLVDAINSLLSRLEEDLESQKRFVANAAHQFRTPLAGLKTYIYAAKKLPANKQMNDMLDKIHAGSERMTHLSSKLLALAKAEPANRNQNYVDVDLNFVGSDVVAAFASEANKREIQINFSSCESPATVLGDPQNLSELAANLIENAVLYSNVGSQIMVSVANRDGITLTVADSGPGIPVTERERVFERFYRVLGTGVAGSGLGLSIVKEIADAHKAVVSIDNGPSGIGTVVRVRFPATAG